MGEARRLLHGRASVPLKSGGKLLLRQFGSLPGRMQKKFLMDPVFTKASQSWRHNNVSAASPVDPLCLPHVGARFSSSSLPGVGARRSGAACAAPRWPAARHRRPPLRALRPRGVTDPAGVDTLSLRSLTCIRV